MLYRYADILRDQFERPIPGALVVVQNMATGSSEPLFNDAGLPIENPQTTDANGAYVFNVESTDKLLVTFRYGGRIVLQQEVGNTAFVEGLIAEAEAAIAGAEAATDLALDAAAKVQAWRQSWLVTELSQGTFILDVIPNDGVEPKVWVAGEIYNGPSSPSPEYSIVGNVITLAVDALRGQVVTAEVGYASLQPKVLAEDVLGFNDLVPNAPVSHALSYPSGTGGDRFKKCVFVTDAPYLASPSKSPAFNQAAIQQAIDDVGSSIGGKVFIPAGVYDLTNVNAPQVNSDLDVILNVQYSNVEIVGDGRGATILRNTVPNTAYSHFIKIGRRVGTPNAVNNVAVRNLTIIGNWLAGNPVGTTSTNTGIDVSNNCTNIRLETLEIKQCGGYGIGMQRDGFKFCAIRDVIISDVAYDGIDWKMDTNNSGYANIVENCTVLRFALVQDLIEGMQAGIDVRQGVDVRDCYIGEYGAGITGCRVNTPVDGAFLKKSVIDNVKCYAASNSGTFGVHVTGNGTQVSNIYVGGCEQGVWFRGTNCQMENVIANNGVIGLRVVALTGETMQNNQFLNIRTTGNSQQGVRVDGAGAIASLIFVNVVSVGNTSNNLMIGANCTGLVFVGGDIPSGISDLGTGTRYVGISGEWNDKGGRNSSQYIERAGDSLGNYLRGVSAAGLPKPFRIQADIASGNLVLEALAPGAFVQFGSGAAYSPSADAAISGYFTVVDASGTQRKIAIIS